MKGVYHWCGQEPLTKYAMVQAIAKAHALNADHLLPDREPSKGAPRPHDSRLECGRLRELGISRHTPFLEGVKEFSKFLVRPTV